MLSRRIVVAICILLFVWNFVEERSIAKTIEKKNIGILLTPLQQALFFDYPKAYAVIETWLKDHHISSLEDTQQLTPADAVCASRLRALPFWKGAWEWWMGGKPHVPLFEKIRLGQLYRVFTPCLLHRDFMHILLNLLAFWALAKQMEVRLSSWRMVLFFILVGSLANIAQYLAGGPFFMGISGIVVGMIFFIWMRQKVAPWEGYSLHKMSILLVFILIGLMWAAELVAMGLHWIEGVPIFIVPIANTAHIVGGLVGMLCGKGSVFARSLS